MLMQVSRLRSLLLASFLFFALLVFTHRHYAPKIHDAYDDIDFSAPFGRLRSYSSSSFPISGSMKPKHCVDPYREPGYFYYPNNSRNNYNIDRTEARWIPYTMDFFNLEDPIQAMFPTDHDAVFREDSIPEDKWFAKSPRNWMKELVSYNKAVKRDGAGKKDEQGVYMDWIRDRRVLLLGDSVVRMQLQYMCEELDEQFKCHPDHHKACGCHVPALNFTVFEWHIPGMYTHHNKTWWWMKDMKLVAFEDQWDAYHKQTLPMVNGLSSRSPDLILFYSGLWDERAFKELARSKFPPGQHPETGLGSSERHITWEEATFFSARLKKFIGFVKEKFGDDVPLMYQALTMHKQSNGSDLAIFDYDRISKFLCRQMGVEVFDWAQIIKGHSAFWKDKTHPDKSPVSWLWDNMMLHYLFRAVGGREVNGKIERLPAKGWKNFGGWQECHPWNV